MIWQTPSFVLHILSYLTFIPYVIIRQYENIQVRLNNQNNQGGDMATVQVAREILKVLDNFDRAFGVIKAETESQIAIEQEYRTTYNNIMTILSDLGVEEVKTVGTEFDYEVHQAVMQKPSADYDEGIVCEEFQKGFKLGDQLIRAAMVSVAA
jgi:molecular chaperone GrpE